MQSPLQDTEPSITVQIADEIANAEGIDYDEVPPMYYSINTELLNTLFKPATEGKITFTHYGYTITAHSDGTVEIEEI